jgi:predicted transcriptional regulator
MTIFSLRLPEELIKKVKDYAEKRRMKIWVVVAEALEQYFTGETK